MAEPAGRIALIVSPTSPTLIVSLSILLALPSITPAIANLFQIPFLKASTITVPKKTSTPIKVILPVKLFSSPSHS